MSRSKRFEMEIWSHREEREHETLARGCGGHWRPREASGKGKALAS